MANLGYVSSFNINGNELSLKDAGLTEIVEEIIEAIGANNGDISARINNLHERSFDALIKIESNNDSEIASIQDGMYKLQYVTVTEEGDNVTETLNNSAILIQKGTNQYLYKDGQISSRTKTDNTWGNWITFEGGVSSVNGQTGAVTITETQLSKGTSTGAGNAVTDINVSNHQITLVKGATYATQSDIDTSIAALVDSAPETLNTLNELAAALGDDPNFATTVATQIGQKYTKPSTGIPPTDLASDIQTNLTLASTALQSFTETDPTVPSHVKNITSQDITNWNNKLSSAPVTSVNGETGAVSLALGDTNVIETIKVNNSALTPVNKAVNITVPTKVTDLTNDSNFTSNTGTITGITMNGVSKGTSGVVDLGTILTSHQDISGKVDKVTGMGLSSNDYTTTEKNKLAGINIGSLDSLTTSELNSIFS